MHVLKTLVQRYGVIGNSDHIAGQQQRLRRDPLALDLFLRGKARRKTFSENVFARHALDCLAHGGFLASGNLDNIPITRGSLLLDFMAFARIAGALDGYRRPRLLTSL